MTTAALYYVPLGILAINAAFINLVQAVTAKIEFNLAIFPLLSSVTNAGAGSGGVGGGAGRGR